MAMKDNICQYKFFIYVPCSSYFVSKGLLRPAACLCRTNFQLSQDPDEDMQIVRDAVGYMKDTLADLKKQKSGVKWTVYTTGHSLGGFLATAVAVELDPEITKCATHPPCSWHASLRHTSCSIQHSR